MINVTYCKPILAGDIVHTCMHFARGVGSRLAQLVQHDSNEAKRTHFRVQRSISGGFTKLSATL